MADKTRAPGKLHKADGDMIRGPNPLVVTLAEAAGLRLGPGQAQALLGTKAANLARLLGAGFPVPAGVVVTPAATGDRDRACTMLRAAAAKIGGKPGREQGPRFAVRSSGTAEDLAGASFAGQYETVLDVGPDELPEAVERVFASAASARVAAYRHRRAHPEAAADTTANETAAFGSSGSARTSAMAVLVQVMVAADAAGVAFTANPLTGDRGEVVVSAVRGLGERLVAGETVGDRWVIRGDAEAGRGEATCQDGREAAITAEQALAIAALARRVEAHFGSAAGASSGQDIEWAIAGGQLHLLQARPMTALPEPEPVAWTPPAKGWWLRNFRLGEWLPDAVTPLFADWLVPRLEAGLAAATLREVGVPLRPDFAVINGWYYTTVRGRTPLPVAVLELLGHPRALRWARAFLIDVSYRPERAAPALEQATAAWRDELLPRYRRMVEVGQRTAARAEVSPGELARLVDEVGELAGEVLWSLSSLGGSAWKIEGVLARFHHRHLASRVDASHQVLLAGLPGTEPGTDLGAGLAAYAAPSADWYWPTAGEAETAGADPQAAERYRSVAAEREAAEQACRAALEQVGEPALLRRWGRLLELAQRYAVVREQQARLFTLGWPLLRTCVLRLGERLAERGAITEPSDVFFLTRHELEAGLRDCGEDQARHFGATVQARRAAWQQQRRLPAPLELGSPPWLAKRQLHRTIEVARAGTGRQRLRAARAIVGHAASPGRASGPVRVVVDPADFARFQAGEVLVARATTPAWTPLFARAAAVVTDGGSLAAHASLVAREYGIPAVVATGDATHQLHTGQQVTVDGSAGVVEPAQ
jgi:phosphohistidine swiveling domain-containing protein